MELAIFLITFAVLWKTSQGVRCYKCDPVSRGEAARGREALCEDFDGSEHFVVDCHSSTMCHKREITLALENTVTKVITRGCTPQTIPGYQEKFGREWKLVDKIQEGYEEACMDETSESRPTATIQCHCRGDLCNSSFNYKSDVVCLLLVMALWLVR